MNIYLDIDGTLIHEDLTDNFGKAAAGLNEFIISFRPHTTYWLTTHCRDGNPEQAREIVKKQVPPELHADIDRIIPTTWDIMKTEGIDWSKDFIWFDNDISAYEWEQIEKGGEGQQVIEVDLRANPKQLNEVIEDVISILS